MADQGTEGLLSPWLRNRRIAAAAPFLKGRVLDYGCGSGVLANLVDSDQYLGVDIDAESLQQAQTRFPQHQFVSELRDLNEEFDTIVSLAVIEHVNDPSSFLRGLVRYLRMSDDACVVVTTPSPSADWIHELGAGLGIFSKHANEEHEELLDREALNRAGQEANFKIALYKRFLLGANQLVVYKRAKG